MHHPQADGYLTPQTHPLCYSQQTDTSMLDDDDYHPSVMCLGDVAEEEEDGDVAEEEEDELGILLLCLHLSRLCGKPRSLRRWLTKWVARFGSAIFVRLRGPSGTTPSLCTTPLVERMLLVAKAFLHSGRLSS